MSWIEIAWHPRGYVLSKRYGLKSPWVWLMITHPDWADRPKKDQVAWLTWNRVRQDYWPKSARCELRDIREWILVEAKKDMPKLLQRPGPKPLIRVGVSKRGTPLAEAKKDMPKPARYPPKPWYA